MTETYEIRLIINRAENGYSARWIESGGQESNPFALSLPLGKGETDELRWYLEEYLQFPGAGDHVKAHNIELKFKDWGRSLFEAVFGTAEGRDVYRNLTDAQRDGQAGLITLGTTEADVLVQPWEMLRDPKGVLALRGVSLRRQLQGTKPAAHFDLGLPLRILLIVSRPIDVCFIDPRNSIPPVLDARDELGGRVQVDFCDPPTLPRLEELISEARKAKRPYHIVHFDGHGTYLPLTGVGALVFEDGEAKTNLVSGLSFGDILARQDVPLVLLEACRGADLSERPVFGSLAPALLESGVGSVLAFSHSVHIRAAQILVERFYRELAGGQSVGAAVQEARAALLADPDRFLRLGPQAESVKLQDWFIPQLYQVGPDPVLIPSKAAHPKLGKMSQVKAAVLSGFPSEPMYRFHGRALELLEIERAFRKHMAVVVSGGGGMGKTALAREAAAWWLRTGRFEAAVFISFEQKAGAARAAQLIGLALEGDDFSRRSGDEKDPEGQWQTAARLFHERQALVVWDNFESTLEIFQHETSPRPSPEREGGQTSESITSFGAEARAELGALYRDLIAGHPRGRLLVTCRPEQTGLPGIKEYALGGLSRPDSLHLLAAALDVKGISIEREGYERHEIDKLLDMLCDHPLSIELIAPHLKNLTPAEIRADFGALLEKFANHNAREGRNQSLLASLEFSRQRLSPSAQQALPWLSWFEGGVFEYNLLILAQFDPAEWAAIRVELEATALIKVESDGLQINQRPYLRFHPTLAYAARPDEVPDPTAAQRFINVYLAVMNLADKLLKGEEPAAGMELMNREEPNLRRALQLAFTRGLRSQGQNLADTLRDYLERAGRNRERDALTGWVRAHLPDAVLDEAVCANIRQHAWTLFTQGQAQQAVEMVQTLLNRLQSEGLADGEDPTSEIALGYGYLGRILYSLGRSDMALEPLKQSVAQFEQLTGENARSNLSAALGDLANTYRRLGQFAAALDVAERALAIAREMKNNREVATSLGQIAQILVELHRYAEAEASYAEALRAAQAAGDLELQGITLQHQGILHMRQGHNAQAVDLYKQALELFQHANNLADEMRTCDLLASAENNRDELDSAEAWYGRARQLALQLNNRTQLAVTAQNLGILYQIRAEETSDLAGRTAWLDRAVASVKESLEINIQEQNQIGAASSYSQLAQLHRMRGDLDAAEQNALKALQIREQLNHPDVWKVYGNLADIARARGDESTAVDWQARADAKRAELECLERGEGAPAARPDGDFLKALTGLAQACYAVRAQKGAIPPDVVEVLAQLQGEQPPVNVIGAFLQAAASGGALPPLPAELPKEISGLMEALKEALKEL